MQRSLEFGAVNCFVEEVCALWDINIREGGGGGGGVEMKETSMDWQNNWLLVNNRCSSLVESLVPKTSTYEWQQRHFLSIAGEIGPFSISMVKRNKGHARFNM